MRTFDELKIVQTTWLYREAKVSPTCGNRALKKLKDSGLIDPEESPTKRKGLNVRESKLLWVTLNGDVIAAR